MKSFFYRNRKKFILIALCFVLVMTLSSCRFNAASWYKRVYTTWGNDWEHLWNGGRGFWNTLWAWPVNLLSYPIAAVCYGIGTVFGSSYFWGIVFTTIIVRTLAWPIYARQNGMSLKMQIMQPELQKIQRKYAGRTDQRSQQMMQQETMKLYKKYGVNPLGCIFTMFLQFPIFMSMYEVVQRINTVGTKTVDGVAVKYTGVFALKDTKVFGLFEMNTSFFDAWGQGAVADIIFGLVVSVGFVAITLLSQKLSSRPPKYQKVHPNDKKNNSQAGSMKTMMIVMNVMFGFMALSNTSLAIYWLIGAVYQIFQAQVGRKLNERKYYKMQEENEKKNIF